MTAISETTELLRQARRLFPQLGDAEIEIEPIEKGGSGRRFYRLRAKGEPSLILAHYTSERAENRHYAELAQFLERHGIRAPRILFHEADAGLIGLEDLGARDLWSYREQDWNKRRALYRSALAEASKLHALPASAIDEIRPQLQPEFDAALYQWEQDYFFEHCLGGYFALPEKAREELRALPALRAIIERLSARPRVLVHRDFQSQNIMVRDEQAYLIDFQGMRLGLAEYDFASLLFDPYVNLAPSERAELLAEIGLQAESETIRFCAMQRLMQALGAYGFLGLVKGNRAFLNHIPTALRALRELVEQMPELTKLSEALGLLNAGEARGVRG